MPTKNIIDIILILGAGQGFFLALGLWMIKDKNRNANRVLAIILAIAAFMLFGRLAYFRFLSPIVFQWSVLLDSIIFLFGPLCHLYFRKLQSTDPENIEISRVHYIPLGLHLIFGMYVFFAFTAEDLIRQINLSFFQIAFFVIEFVGIVSNLYYWISNSQLIWSASFRAKQHKKYLFQFLTFFQLSVGVFLILWAINFGVKRLLGQQIPFVNYNSVWTAISVFVFGIGYFVLVMPHIFRWIEPVLQSRVKSRMTDDQITELGNKLESVVIKNKLFLNAELSLRMVSEQLGTTTHNLSWYLNHVHKMTFYEYINRCRVQEFLIKVDQKQYQTQTILGMAMDVGFNSKSTFNKTFKTLMNDTPSNYIKQQQETLQNPEIIL